MKSTVSIIGVGNLTQSLLKALIDKKYTGKVFIHDIDKNKKKFSLRNKIIFKNNISELVSASNFLIIAVKPNNYKKICLAIQSLIKSDTVIISVMAGIKCKSISSKCGRGELPIARVMTNINARFGYATTFIHYNKYVKNSQINKINKFWKIFGSLNNVRSETEIDKVTALLGSGPAYFLEFMQSMIMVFEKFGFSKKKSNTFVNELFYGTAYLCKNDKRDAESIKKTIISKGGTTEAALKSLKKNNFQKILEKSIIQAFKKAKNISELI